MVSWSWTDPLSPIIEPSTAENWKSGPSDRNKFQPMRTADWSKSTNKKPGDRAHVNAIQIADPHNLNICNFLCLPGLVLLWNKGYKHGVVACFQSCDVLHSILLCQLSVFMWVTIWVMQINGQISLAHN